MIFRSSPPFRDRGDAGRRLAELLDELRPRRPIVVAIPRGGVEVGRAVADSLDAPLDVILVRKLPIPFAPETAFGVIAEDGTTILDHPLVEELGLDQRTIEGVRQEVLGVLRRYADEFADARPALSWPGATIVMVDDGLATGYTMLGAVGVGRARGAGYIAVAAPVSSDTAAARIEAQADRLVCPIIDPGFVGVSAYYSTFPQLDDRAVRRLLAG